MGRLAFISGVGGVQLSDDERRFFSQTKPLGLILFARNIGSEIELKRLIEDVRLAVGEDQFFVLVDQEGGRVQRLRPPLFPALPAARRYGELYLQNREKALGAAFEIGQLMGSRLLQFGINVNCTPVLDVPEVGAHEIIGDRSFAFDTDIIAALGRAQAMGHLKSGVLPVVKHIPGHGRAKADSHLNLPLIDAVADQLKSVDFVPFRALNDLPLAMTAHVILSAFDEKLPVSVSPKAIEELVRGEIGFDGFLMCDDISMQALSGSVGERAACVLAAGCDGALHCNGKFDEMVEVAENAIELEGASLRRFEASFPLIAQAEDFCDQMALQLLDEDWAFN